MQYQQNALVKVKGEAGAGGSSPSPPASAKRSLPDDAPHGGEATANKKLRVDFVGKGASGNEEPTPGPPLVDVRSSA